MKKAHQSAILPLLVIMSILMCRATNAYAAPEPTYYYDFVIPSVTNGTLQVSLNGSEITNGYSFTNLNEPEDYSELVLTMTPGEGYHIIFNGMDCGTEEYTITIKTADYTTHESSVASLSGADQYTVTVPQVVFAKVGVYINDHDISANRIYYLVSDDGSSVSVTSVPEGVNAYSGSIEIPASVTINGKEYPVTGIGESAFDSCSGLTSVSMPNSITTIGHAAFSGCTNLGAITIPNSVTTIENVAFYGCKSLTSLNIPGSVTTIGDNVFGSCSITSITVDPDNKYFDSRDNCNAIINTATNTLITGCITTIIPNTVTCIGKQAFQNCSLTSITIPNSVTRIAFMAFIGCSKMKTISIPGSVNSLGWWAFGDMESVYMYSKTPPAVDPYDRGYTRQTKLYVPVGCVDAYTAAGYTQQFTEILEMSNPCATPAIFVKNGKYCFDCETEGAEIHWSCSMPSQEWSGTGNCIESIPSTLIISAYATAEGYSPSETATVTVDLSKIGDINRDGTVNMADVSALVNIVLGR